MKRISAGNDSPPQSWKPSIDFGRGDSVAGQATTTELTSNPIHLPASRESVFEVGGIRTQGDYDCFRYVRNPFDDSAQLFVDDLFSCELPVGEVFEDPHEPPADSTLPSMTLGASQFSAPVEAAVLETIRLPPTQTVAATPVTHAAPRSAKARTGPFHSTDAVYRRVMELNGPFSRKEFCKRKEVARASKAIGECGSFDDLWTLVKLSTSFDEQAAQTVLRVAVVLYEKGRYDDAWCFALLVVISGVEPNRPILKGYTMAELISRDDIEGLLGERSKELNLNKYF